MRYMSIQIGLLAQLFFMVLKGGQDDSLLNQPLSAFIKLGSYSGQKPQRVTEHADLKFFNALAGREEYLWADYDKICLQKWGEHRGATLFVCPPDDHIKAVHYRSLYDDLIVATRSELFVYSIANAMKRVLCAIPLNQSLRSIEQLSDHRLLAMMRDHVHYWNLESGHERIFLTKGKRLRFVVDDMHNQRLFFTGNRQLVFYDLKTGSSKDIDIKVPIQSSIYKNGALYMMTKHSVLHYDLEGKAYKRIIFLPKDLLQSMVFKGDGTQLLLRTNDQVLLYDVANKYLQTIVSENNGRIWAASFYDKNDDQYIFRTGNGVELYDKRTCSTQVLFEKDKKENALFGLHYNNERNELLITMMKRVLIVPFSSQKSYVFKIFSDDDYIRSARYNEGHLQVVSIKGRCAEYDLALLDASEDLESDSSEIDIQKVPDQIDEYEKLFEEHDAKRGTCALQAKGYQMLMANWVVFLSFFLHSLAWLYQG